MFRTYLPSIILIVFFGCSSGERENSGKIESLISDSSWKNSMRLEYDTIDMYLSDFDLSECGSIKNLLIELRHGDQVYREEIASKPASDSSRFQFFQAMHYQDSLNQVIMRKTLVRISRNKECINTEEEMDAVWLVAHHSGDIQLINEVRPIVEYGRQQGIMTDDATELFFSRLDSFGDSPIHLMANL